MWILDSSPLDSGFQQKKFRGFWIPDSVTWGESSTSIARVPSKACFLRSISFRSCAPVLWPLRKFVVTILIVNLLPDEEG